MKKSFSSAVVLFLAVWVLALQVAGTSPVLHGMLHGDQAQAHSCSDHDHSNDDYPGETEGCNDACAVNLLHAGITLNSHDLAVADAPVLISVNDTVDSQRVDAAPEFKLSARAPPVL